MYHKIIIDDCASYVIIADEAVTPTCELPSHLTVHNHLIETGSPYRATVRELEDYDVVLWQKHGSSGQLPFTALLGAKCPASPCRT